MKKTIFENVTIIDGTGSDPVNGIVVVNSDNTINYVGSFSNYSSEEYNQNTGKIMNLEGYTIMPGLFNTHVHLDLNLPFKDIRYDDYGIDYRALVSFRRAAEALMAGVTTLRCVGTGSSVDHAVKKAINKKMLMGPRIMSAGPLMISQGGHCYNVMFTEEANGITEFRKLAREQIKNGADHLKICLTGGLGSPLESIDDRQLTDDEIAAVVEVAHGAGKKVTAHLGSDRSIRDAIRLGVDSVEHGYSFTKETAELMVKEGVFLTPTLAVSNANEFLKKHGSPEYQLKKQEQAQGEHINSIKRAIGAGVKLCCGTDLLPSDPIDGTNATVREIELLTEVGLTPIEAIKAATKNSAEMCGVLEQTGTIEVGKNADLIICKGNPSENIQDLRNLELVMKDGSIVFSKIKNNEESNFNMLPHGEILSGGTFMKW